MGAEVGEGEEGEEEPEMGERGVREGEVGEDVVSSPANGVEKGRTEKETKGVGGGQEESLDFKGRGFRRKKNNFQIKKCMFTRKWKYFGSPGFNI